MALPCVGLVVAGVTGQTLSQTATAGAVVGMVVLCAPVLLVGKAQALWAAHQARRKDIALGQPVRRRLISPSTAVVLWLFPGFVLIVLAMTVPVAMLAAWWQVPSTDGQQLALRQTTTYMALAALIVWALSLIGVYYWQVRRHTRADRQFAIDRRAAGLRAEDPDTIMDPLQRWVRHQRRWFSRRPGRRGSAAEGRP